MGKVVKLNEFRKRKAKAERDKQAEMNRRLHGRTKVEQARDELQKKRLTRAVDGARLVPPPATSDEPRDPDENRADEPRDVDKKDAD